MTKVQVFFLMKRFGYSSVTKLAEKLGLRGQGDRGEAEGEDGDARPGGFGASSRGEETSFKGAGGVGGGLDDQLLEGKVARNEWGYYGYHLRTDLGDGIGGEIQLHTPQSWALKLQTDSFYEKWRDYSEEQRAGLPPERQREYEEDKAQSTMLWNNFISSLSPDIMASASDAVTGTERIDWPTVPSKTTQEPEAGSKTSGGLPSRAGRESSIRPSASMEKPLELASIMREGVSSSESFITSPPKTIILPGKTAGIKTEQVRKRA